MTIPVTQQLTHENSKHAINAIEYLKSKKLNDCNHINTIRNAVDEFKKKKQFVEAALLVEKLLLINKNAHNDVYFNLLSLYKNINQNYAINLANFLLLHAKTNTNKKKLHSHLYAIYREKSDHLRAATHAVLKITTDAEPAINELREYTKYLNCMNDLSHAHRINPSEECRTKRNQALQTKVNKALNIKQITKAIQSFCVNLGLKKFVHVISEQIHDHIKTANTVCEKSVSRIINNYLENQKAPRAA